MKRGRELNIEDIFSKTFNYFLSVDGAIWISLISLGISVCTFRSNRKYQEKLEAEKAIQEQRRLKSDVDTLLSTANGLMGIDTQTEAFHKFASRDKMNRAKELISKAYTLMPTYADVYYAYGLYYMGIKNFRTAENAFRKAIEINPNLASAHNNLFLIAPPKNQEEAEEHLRKAVKLAPASPIYLVNLGVLEIKKQNLEQAEKNFKSAIQSDPGYPNSYICLGQMYLNSKNLSDGETYAKKALEIYPDFADAHILLSDIYVERNLFAEALIEIKKAIALEPNEKSYLDKLQSLEGTKINIE